LATLLPNGRQVFLDANGRPLAGGLVYHYIPGTTTAKDTWQDAGQVALNTNPIVLDAAGAAIIFGSGAYRQVVNDQFDAVIYDQLTYDTAASGSSWSGHSGGSANIQTVTAANFTSADGQGISFIAGYTNTSELTINPNGSGPIAVLKDTASGPVALTGGEVVAGGLYSVTYDATRGAFHIANYTNQSPAFTSATTGGLTVTGAVVQSGVISASLSSDTADWAPAGFSTASRIRATASSAYTLSGIAGGADGRRIIIENVGTAVLSLSSNDAASTAGNRFATPRLHALRPNETVSLIYDGSKSGWLIDGAFHALPCMGQQRGLVITVTTDTQATIAADEVVLGDTYGGRTRQTAVSLTVATGTTGANALDAGTVAANTWYAVHVIYNPTTRTVAGLLSTSATAPTLPGGYTYAARFGWVLTDGSSLLKRTIQRGADAQYALASGTNTTTLPTIGSGAQTGWRTVAVSGFAPSTATSINATVVATTAQATALAPNSSVYSATLASPRPPICTKAGTIGSSIDFNSNTGSFVLESTNVYYTGDANSVASCIGWRDAI
jgi:hypothetical protein